MSVRRIGANAMVEDAETVAQEIEEFRSCVRAYLDAPSAGTKYALEMSAAALQILGVDPSTITPDGIDENV